MAVHDFIPGISAEIIVNREPVTEIADEDNVEIMHPDPTVGAYQQKRTVSNYIECETGQEFSVKLSVGPPYKMNEAKLGFHITVDGKEAWTAICARPDWMKNKKWEGVVKGVKEGKGHGCKEKNFRFAKIDRHSNGESIQRIRDYRRDLKNVGIVEIKVYRETFGKIGGDTTARFAGFLGLNGLEVPEEALKGEVTSHGVALGQMKKASRGLVARTEMKDGKDFPMIIFRFLYLSQEALDQLHNLQYEHRESTISPSPIPQSVRSAYFATVSRGRSRSIRGTPVSHSRSRRSSISAARAARPETAEEKIARMMREIETLRQETAVGIKRERDDGEEMKTNFIRENKRVRYEGTVTETGEVMIDLEDDDEEVRTAKSESANTELG